MNKILWLKTTAIGLVTYALVGFFGVPYVVKNIFPSKIDEATKGGEFSVQSVSFNPFTFRFSAEGVSFKTPEATPLFDLKQFVVNLDPIDYLWNGGWVIHELSLEAPRVTVVHSAQGEFNFGWLSTQEDENKSDTSSPLPNLIIENLTLKGGVIDYTDYSEGKNYHQAIDPIGFHLENIRLRQMSKNQGDMRLYATINEGGFVDLRGKIESMDPYKIRGSVAFNSGKLSVSWRYFEDKLPIEVADGSLSAGFDYRIDSSDLNATELSRLHVEGSKLRLLAKHSKAPLFSMEALKLHEGNVQPLKKIFNARLVGIDGIDLVASRSSQGLIDWITYLDQIKAAFPEDENETKEPWTFAIDGLDVRNVALEWKDQAPKEPYSASIGNISLHSGLLSSNAKIPLNASVKTGELSIASHRAGKKIAGFEALAVEGITIDRNEPSAMIKRVFVTNPTASIMRLKDGSFDVARLAYRSNAPSAPRSEKPFGYRIHEIRLDNGSIAFQDKLPSKTVALNLDRLNLQLLGVQSDPAVPNRIDLSTRINTKGSAALRGSVTRAPLTSSGHLMLKGLDLSLFDPYIEPSSYASLRRGILGVKVDYRYAADHARINGVVGLEDWVVNDRRDNSVILGWHNIGVTPFRYAYPDNRLKINQLNINGLYTNALIDSNKVLNYSTLSKSVSTPSESKSSSRPFGLDIIKLTLSNSSATFADQSLPLPFKTYIHDLEGSILGISTTQDVSTFVKLKGGVDRYGMAHIGGKLNTKAPKDFTDMNVRFDNLELKHYTPYSLQFLGYEIDQGKLFLDLGYNIDRGKLLSSNRVTIKQIELGKEQAGGSPWPMRLVVALLEDSDGIIDIDLPIEGDVNKPDFKYGKVVWQVIGNLLTKAVTAPFRFLGSLMGIESDTLSSIEFEPGSAVILPPEQEKLDKLSDMLHKRPKLMLQVYGGIQKEADEKALRIKKLIDTAVAYNKNGGALNEKTLSLSTLEAMAKDTLGRSRVNAIKDPLEASYSEEAMFVRHYTQALIDALIPLQTLEANALTSLAAQRSNAIVSALSKDSDVGKRISVRGTESVKLGEKGNIPNRLEIAIP